MDVGACDINIRRPIYNRWRGCLPHRIKLSQAPTFVNAHDDMHPVRRDPSNPTRITAYYLAPSDEFKEWAKAFGIKDWEVMFWADVLEWQYIAANDHTDYPDAWSVGFAEDTHLMYYKLRWM